MYYEQKLSTDEQERSSVLQLCFVSHFKLHFILRFAEYYNWEKSLYFTETVKIL